MPPGLWGQGAGATGLPQAGCGKQELVQDMEVGTSAARSRCVSWHGLWTPNC